MSTTNPFSLEGKTTILTGSAGYFGRKFAEELLANGSKVFLFDKDENNIDLANSLSSRFGSENIEYFQVDFYNEEAYRESLTQVAEKNESIDILVNNAFEFSKRTGFNDPSGKMPESMISFTMSSVR